MDDTTLQEYKTLLSFPSISSEPGHKQDIEACFNWVKEYVEKLNFKTERWDTSGHPTLFAESQKIEGQPTLLLYGHYDVQPIDPIELWQSNPFNAEVRDGIIYARGAQDNKGQLFYVLQALKSFQGKYPINIKLLIEGEEEIGSCGLEKILKEKSQKLQSDHLAIVDCGIPNKDTPAVSLGMRGLITLEMEVTGTKIDLHSGTHGGIAYNPLRAICELIASAKDENGKITIPGFYDSIIPLSEEEKKHIAFDIFDEKKYLEEYGSSATGGETSLPVMERNWLRPTLEINGVWGGYIGEGFKTVIPSKAHAKLSCRIVRGQDPEKMALLVADYFEKKAPPGIQVKVKRHSGGGPAMMTTPTSQVVQAFAKAFSDIFKKPCLYILEGASIPIVAALTKASGAEAVLVGVGLATDQIHAPNEHFGLDRSLKGRDVVVAAINHLKL